MHMLLYYYNEVKINEIIKEKRLALGYTQEQLAKFLNLTTPAVNKWERGISYPDITILPALARILKTDLNTLLSFKDDLSDYEVVLFLNDLAAIKDFQQAYRIAIDKINEYPTCDNLIVNVAVVLEGLLLLNEMGEAIKYQQKIDSLLEQCLTSDNPMIKNQAQAVLINKYINQGKLEQAEKLINELPEQHLIDKKQKLVNLYIAQAKLEAAAKLQEEKLLVTVNEIPTMLLTLMEIAIKQERYDDAEIIADIYKEMHEVFGLWKYSSYTAHFQLCINRKKRLECLKILKEMFNAINKGWNINTSPLYRHITAKKIDQTFVQEMKNMLVTSIKSDPDYKFITDDLEMNKILEKYK